MANWPETFTDQRGYYTLVGGVKNYYYVHPRPIPDSVWEIMQMQEAAKQLVDEMKIGDHKLKENKR